MWVRYDMMSRKRVWTFWYIWFSNVNVIIVSHRTSWFIYVPGFGTFGAQLNVGAVHMHTICNQRAGLILFRAIRLCLYVQRVCGGLLFVFLLSTWRRKSIEKIQYTLDWHVTPPSFPIEKICHSLNILQWCVEWIYTQKSMYLFLLMLQGFA